VRHTWFLPIFVALCVLVAPAVASAQGRRAPVDGLPAAPTTVTVSRISSQEVRLTVRSPYLADCLPGVPHARTVEVTGERFRDGHYGTGASGVAAWDINVFKQVTCRAATSTTLVLHLGHSGKWLLSTTIFLDGSVIRLLGFGPDTTIRTR
jgi:hypothetical protein